MSQHTQISVRLNPSDFSQLEGLISHIYPLAGIVEHTSLTLKIKIAIHLAHHLLIDLNDDDLTRIRQFIADLDL